MPYFWYIERVYQNLNAASSQFYFGRHLNLAYDLCAYTFLLRFQHEMKYYPH